MSLTVGTPCCPREVDEPIRDGSDSPRAVRRWPSRSAIGGGLLVLVLTAPAGAQDRPAAELGGRRHLAAGVATSPIELDGRLDEAAWAQAEVASDFVQSEPVEGRPSTERTEVRVLYDDESLYIGARCLDSVADGLIVNDIRKDFGSTDQDTFAVLLDTFADRRNGYVFETNPGGAKSDLQIANEGREVNQNWDGVWWVASASGPDGWSVEMRIPFATLRFDTEAGRPWGLNFSRRIRRKNEIAYWAPVSRAYSIYRASSAGDLTGLTGLGQGRDLRIKPYLLGGAVRGVGGGTTDLARQVGLDVKVGVTPSLTLDVTANPDFAQAEADEQQVNLTQFSLFFPEKREFFLENSGLFYFGDIPRNSRQSSRFRPPEEDLLLFFSRRIGLDDDGRQVPLYGGARLTGRGGGFEIGAMTIQGEGSGDQPGSNYSVLRLRRDVFGSSDVGAIVVSRQAMGRPDDFNRVVGGDVNFRFFEHLSLNGFAARSTTPGLSGDDGTAKASIGWEDSSKRLQASVITIGENFRDDLGFVRRTGVTRRFYDAAWMPRPAWLRRRGLLEVEPHARIFDYHDAAGTLVTRRGHVGVQVTWESGAWIEYAFEPRQEAIDRPFAIRSDVVIPAGHYDWNQHVLVYETDHSRRLSGSARATLGGFWNGTQRSAQIAALYRPSHRLVIDLGLQVNDIQLTTPAASFVTTLVNLRTGYSFTTNMFIDSLLQYRNDLRQFSANVRFNLIHRPLSDLFIVYNEQQLTDLDTPAGRGLVVKYTHMLAF